MHAMTSFATHDRSVLIRTYQTVMKNDELLKRQKRLNRVEELLDAFRRKLVVLGRVEAGEEVRHGVAVSSSKQLPKDQGVLLPNEVHP